MILFLKQFLILVIASILFTGCCGTICKPEVIHDVQYIKQSVPELPAKPVFVPYNVQVVDINNTAVYFLTKEDASLMAANWIDFRDYSFKLENIIKSLDSNTSLK